jgi:beta-glucanase (GH16 family)
MARIHVSVMAVIFVFFGLSAIPVLAATPNLGASYSMSEGSGTTISDSSGNANTGTITGATWTTGKFDNALLFNGSNSYVNLSKTDAYDTYATGTIEFWAKSNGGTNYQDIFNSDSGSCKNPFEMAYHNGNFEIWATTSGCNNTAINLTVPIANQTQWHHIAYVVSTTGNKVYVDGVQATPTYLKGNASTVFFFKNAATNKTLYNIGRSVSDNTETFNGLIDELRIYNRPLSQSEIQSDMNTPIFNPIPDTTAPTISLTAPTDGTTVSGSVNLTANASDNVAVAGVKFFVDGVLTSIEDTTSPYSVSWNTLSVANGSHTVFAVAHDAAGNTATSSTATVTVNNIVDTTAPTVSITAPADGSTVSGGVTISASSTDTIAVASVQFQIDGTNFGSAITTAPYQINWDTTQATNASHAIKAVATDTSGNSASSSINVTVNNIVATSTGYIFDDEFNNSTLDTNQWVAMDRPGDSSNKEIQCYKPSNVTETGGNLVITTMPDTSCAGFNYTSGMVQWKSLNFTYGTVEIRAKLPDVGTWPALWFLGYNCQTSNVTDPGICPWPQPGSNEIDMTEVMGNRSYINQQIHSTGTGDPGCTAIISDSSQNWHTYRLEWQPGLLVWKVDGIATCTITTGVPNTSMFLIINTAMQTGMSITSLQQFSVDYVRVSSGTSTPTQAPTISSFAANLSTVTPGQSSTLSWNVNGSPAPTISIDQGIGTVSGNSITVSPSATTTYTLSATNSAGTATSSVAIAVSSTAPPSNPLVGAFGFSEGTGGVTADVSPVQNNATLNGATWTTLGKFGNALSFNGSSNVLLSKLDTYDTFTQGTIETWIKPGTSTHYGGIFSAERQNANCVSPLEMGITTSGQLEVWAGNASCVTVFQAMVTIPNPTAWHHIAYVVTDTGNQIYVDGVLQTPTYITGNASSKIFFSSQNNGTTQYYIGSTGDPAEKFTGTIDETRIYNTPLTQSQIESDMATPITP